LVRAALDLCVEFLLLFVAGDGVFTAKFGGPPTTLGNDRMPKVCCVQLCVGEGADNFAPSGGGGGGLEDATAVEEELLLLPGPPNKAALVPLLWGPALLASKAARAFATALRGALLFFEELGPQKLGELGLLTASVADRGCLSLKEVPPSQSSGSLLVSVEDPDGTRPPSIFAVILVVIIQPDNKGVPSPGLASTSPFSFSAIACMCDPFLLCRLLLLLRSFFR